MVVLDARSWLVMGRGCPYSIQQLETSCLQHTRLRMTPAGETESWSVQMTLAVGPMLVCTDARGRKTLFVFCVVRK